MDVRDPDHFETVAEALGLASASTFPGRLGLEVVDLGVGTARMRADIRPEHLAPNGYLHAGMVVSLADTAAGYGCVANLPEGATGFTTIEMKVNFLRTLLEGSLQAEATMTHGGRTTQVWDVTVTDESTGKTMALFRCSQLIIYPRSPS